MLTFMDLAIEYKQSLTTGVARTILYHKIALYFLEITQKFATPEFGVFKIICLQSLNKTEGQAVLFFSNLAVQVVLLKLKVFSFSPLLYTTFKLYLL